MKERRVMLPTSRIGAYGIIAIVALSARLAGLLIYGIDQTGDTPQYDQIAINVAQGHGYSLSAVAPYLLTTQREPGYPLFLAIIYFMFGHSPLAAVLGQCLLGAGACLLIYEAALVAYNDRRIAFWAGLANAIYVPIAIFSLRMLSEIVAMTLLAAVAYLLVRLIRRPSWLLSGMLGVAMGLLALSQLVFVLLPAIVAPLIVIFGQRDFLRSIRNAAIAGVATGLVILPWIGLNYSLHGALALGDSVRMGANIYDRVSDRGMKGDTDVYYHLLDLERSGMPASAINRIYVVKAWDIVREYPIRYAVGTVLAIADLWKFGLSGNDIDTSGPITFQGTRGALMQFVKYFFQAANLVVLVTGILGMLSLRNPCTWSIAALVGYPTLMFALISYTIPRHNVMALQLMLLFASACIVRSISWYSAQSAAGTARGEPVPLQKS